MTRSLSSSCFPSSYDRWYGLFFIAILLLGKACGEQETPDMSSYGVDVSFPMQHHHVTTSHRPLGDGITSFYDHFLQGCRDYYKEKQERCDNSERDRIKFNLQQPSDMQNYTSAGYAKVSLPRHLMKQLEEFWGANKDNQSQEKWPLGNTYCNHWESPTYMLALVGNSLRNSLIHAVQEILEAWSGQSLVFASLYGIRIYKEGAILAPHIDRLPLVTSAIINVAQDLDDPWILEVIGHDGEAHNVTMSPGDMVLYESHSVIHGRPFPLKGRFYANVFLHFEPHGHTERHNAKSEPEGERAKREYLDALENPPPKIKAGDLPDYIEDGSKEEEKWRQNYVYKVDPITQSRKRRLPELPNSPPTTSAHAAAAKGDLSQLKQLAKENPNSLFEQDRNGWRPIHEAARAGHADVIDYLVKNGAAVNERTNDGRGATALWWAENLFDDDHPVILALRQHGAVNHGPVVDEL